MVKHKSKAIKKKVRRRKISKTHTYTHTGECKKEALKFKIRFQSVNCILVFCLDLLKKK